MAMIVPCGEHIKGGQILHETAYLVAAVLDHEFAVLVYYTVWREKSSNDIDKMSNALRSIAI